MFLTVWNVIYCPPMIENSFPQQVVIVVSFIIPDDTVHKLLNVSPSLLMAEETLG